MPRKKDKGGRPIGLNDSVQKVICRALERGDTRENAVRLARVGKAAFYRWMKEGRRATKGKFREFRDAVEAAEARCASKYAAVIQRAALEREETTTKTITLSDGSTRTEETKKKVFEWTAAAWWLERRCPDDYSPHRKKDIEDAVQKIIAKAINDGTLVIGNTGDGAARGKSATRTDSTE